MSLDIGQLVGTIAIDHRGVKAGIDAAKRDVAAGMSGIEQTVATKGSSAGTKAGQGLASGVKAGADRSGAAVKGAMDTAVKSAGDGGKKAGKKFGDGVKEGFDDIKKSWKSFATGFFAAAAAEKVFGFFSDAITEAGNLEQSIGGVEAVFKKNADQIKAFGETSADAVGLSKNAFNELATITGSLLKNKGLEDFSDKTLQLIKIGADLSATYGGTAKDAIDALNAALRGEGNPIERYGITINQTAVNAELAAKGLDKLTGSALEQAKAQTTIDIIMRQSTDAMGKFAAEADTLQGKQQRAAAEWENQKAALGEKLLPVMVAVTDFLSSTMIPAFGTLVETLSALPGPTKAALAALVAIQILKGPLGGMLDSTKTKLTDLRAEMALQRTLAMGAAASYDGLGARTVGLSAKMGVLKTMGMGGLKSAGSALFGLMGGPWGLAITGATALITGWMQAQENAKKAAEELTSTLDKQSGEFTKDTRKKISEAFSFDVSAGDLEKLRKAGVDLSKAIDVTLEGGPALKEYRAELERLGRTTPGLGAAAQGLSSSMENQNEVVQDSVVMWANQKAMLDQGKDAAKGAAGAQDDLADATGAAGGAAGDSAPKVKTYVEKTEDLKTAAEKAETAQKKLAEAILDVYEAAEKSMSSEIDYEQSLDDAQERVKKRLELEKQLKNAGGTSARTRELQDAIAKEKDAKKRAKLQEQLAKSQAKDSKNATDEQKRLREELEKYAATLDVGTQAGRDNKEALIDLAAGAKQYAEDMRVANEPTKDIKTHMEKAREEFIKVAMQMNGGNKKAAEQMADDLQVTTGYVDTLTDAIDDIPAQQVTKFKVEADKAKAELAELKKILAGDWDKTVRITSIYEYVGSAAAQQEGMRRKMEASGRLLPEDRAKGGRIKGYAGGGLITGPGTSTSDSILARVVETGNAISVSNREFVSTGASTARNQAALEAGNAGATLTVAGTGPDLASIDTLARAIGRELVAALPNARLSVSAKDAAEAMWRRS